MNCQRVLILLFSVWLTGHCANASFDESPGSVADYSSRWFLLHTDLAEDEAHELLDKLESMLRIMSQYWSAPPRKVIECYVVDDLNNWPDGSFPDDKRNAVRGGGVTHAVGVRRGQVTDLTAIVYASSKFGTPQHEAVHAYCYHAFGESGPTWYAEGMAEMGTYWVEGSAAVHCPDYVIEYLKNSARPSIDEITGDNQQTGDGWKNYAWRWALCHFMVTNPNYRDRFRTLGASLLTGRGGSFERLFATQREELEFEFAFFLDQLETGFDAEKCSWDWKKRFRDPSAKRDTSAQIRADRGWQPTGARLAGGTTYVLGVEGSWTTGADVATAAPASIMTELGAIVGCLVLDGTLSEPFLITASESWQPAGNGDLYLRCNDAWTSLEDNDGSVTVTLRAMVEPAN